MVVHTFLIPCLSIFISSMVAYFQTWKLAEWFVYFQMTFKTWLYTMSSAIEKEDYLIQIRDKLRKEGVKLWLSPYFNDVSCTPSTSDIDVRIYFVSLLCYL